MMEHSRRQTLFIYSVPLREGNDCDWLNIGLAFPHQDGKGFDLKLEALPLNARLVLREPIETASEKVECVRLSLAEQVAAFERAVIEECLVETGGKISAVMELLNVPRRTLSEKMVRLGVDRRRCVGMAAPDPPLKTGAPPAMSRNGLLLGATNY